MKGTVEIKNVPRYLQMTLDMPGLGHDTLSVASSCF